MRKGEEKRKTWKGRREERWKDEMEMERGENEGESEE